MQIVEQVVRATYNDLISLEPEVCFITLNSLQTTVIHCICIQLYRCSYMYVYDKLLEYVVGTFTVCKDTSHNEALCNNEMPV